MKGESGGELFVDTCGVLMLHISHIEEGTKVPFQKVKISVSDCINWLEVSGFGKMDGIGMDCKVQISSLHLHSGVADWWQCLWECTIEVVYPESEFCSALSRL